MEISSGRNATAKMKKTKSTKKMPSQSLWHLFYIITTHQWVMILTY